MKTLLIATAVASFAFASGPDSGLGVGDHVIPFHPQHVTGPNKGTDACPPWTYGRRPQIQVWINNEDPAKVETFVKTLNDAVLANKEKELKAFFIFVNDDPKAAEPMLTTLAEKTGANDLALAYLGKANEAVGDYKVNLAPEVKNTFFVYVNKKVTAKFVNLEPDEKGLADLKAAITAVTATP